MDELFMKRAIELAKKGQGYTSPNPCVGAVIVKNGKIVGSGYHKKAGSDHAEIVAIKDALKNKNSLRGAILYSTLEPCCHYGATGPCTEEIVRFEIGKVVIAHGDPSKKVNSKGIKFLRKNGVEVVVGVLENEARMLNQPFLKTSLCGVPFVTLKAGISLDGKIATRSGKSEWITNELSRKHGKKLRDNYDAVIVGANTVVIDNPILASGRIGGCESCGKGIFRVVIDGRLKVKTSSRVFRDENVLVATTSLVDKKVLSDFAKAGIKVVKFGKKKVDIKSLLKYLYREFGIQSVFVEGGGGVNGSFVDEKLVDDIYFYISPEIIGGVDAISVVGGVGASELKKSLRLKKVDVKMLKDDILVHGIINQY